jgi:hypothetical protein
MREMLKDTTRDTSVSLGLGFGTSVLIEGLLQKLEVLASADGGEKDIVLVGDYGVRGLRKKRPIMTPR